MMTYDVCSAQAAFVIILDLGANTLHWQQFFYVLMFSFINCSNVQNFK